MVVYILDPNEITFLKMVYEEEQRREKMYVTPCVSICKIIEGECLGCNRTKEQIEEVERDDE